MLRLLLLTCVLTAAAAQRTYYCGGSITIRDSDFIYITRKGPDDSGYPSDLICELNLSAAKPIFLEIQSFSLNRATLSVSEFYTTLFRGSSLPKYQSTLVATSGSMKIRFDSTGDYSNFAGAVMRIRVFDLNNCPPGWTYMYGNCFGKGNYSGRLSFPDAQRACNSMKANLLQLPSSYYGTLRSFRLKLPANLQSYYTWVGLTDRTSYGQNAPYWLNNVRQYDTTEMSCYSGRAYRSCLTRERCAAFYDRYYSYTIYMDTCTDENDYACSMPAGGTSVFYRVPDGDSIITNSAVSAGVIWGSIIGSMIVLSLIIGGIYAGVRSSHVHRAAGATSVVVSTGRVTIPPPTVPYPVQQTIRPPVTNVPMYPSTNAPLYPPPPPPAYNVVASGGYNNNAYGN